MDPIEKENICKFVFWKAKSDVVILQPRSYRVRHDVKLTGLRSFAVPSSPPAFSSWFEVQSSMQDLCSWLQQRHSQRVQRP